MGRLRDDLFRINMGLDLRTSRSNLCRNRFQRCIWISVIFIVVLLNSCQFIVAADSDSHHKSNSHSNNNADLQLFNETELPNYLTYEEPSQNIDNHHHYTHQWAVHIVGGQESADRIADKHGFINAGEIFPSYYHFVHRRVTKRSVEPSHEYHARLSAEPEVRWLQQQKAKRRTKRDFMSFSSSALSSRGKEDLRRLRSARRSRAVAFNDARWPAMWYLNRGPGLDMNVMEAWGEGVTGKGIVVTILDDGLEKDHPDIVRNYDPMASFDVNSLDMDPMPTYDLTDSNRHGTRCAGEVAAEANNSICAVGIAYEAGVGGVRMLDGDVTDAVEARSLSHNPQHIDIYSASWGPDDDGKTVDGPGELATRAFVEGVTKGRSGKGSIFVWASGNGGRDHDNCNCDGYTNSIWTLSISSATENGLVPWYSEACSSTLATTYSSGGTGEKQIVTIDLHHACTSSHTGTSASAPLAAGICALALQANTNLTWRDMQHIVVRTARPQNLIASDWAINGVGRNVSHSFGYGLMDAGAMVKLARKWKTVPEQNKCEIHAPYSEKNIPAKSKVTLDLKVTNCTGVNFLEHVQAKVTLTSGRRGDLQIFLVSPAGTRSVLLAHRRHDLNRSGFTDWPFMTVHSWGEYPIGKWTLEIHNEGRYAGRTVLKRWSLIAYGTEEDANSSSIVRNDLSASNPKLVSNLPIPNSKSNTAPALKSSTNSSSTSHTSNGNDEKVGSGDILNGNGNTKADMVNGNSEVGVLTSINKKPYRQKQFKGKFLSKKQKLAASGVASQSSTSRPPPLRPNGHLDSDDEEFRQFLHAKFGLTRNQSFSTVNGTISIVSAPQNNNSISSSPSNSNNKESESTFGSISSANGDGTTSSSSSSSSSLVSSMHPDSLPLNRHGKDDSLSSSPYNNFPSNYSSTSGKSSLVEGPRVTYWETTTAATVNHTQSSQGKLQTWALVAHGITADPNGQDGGSGIGSGDMKSGTATDTAVAGSEPSAVEFDGSVNTIVMPSHVHSPPLTSNAEVADSSLSVATSVASSPSSSSSSSSNCAKVSANGQCLECNTSMALLQGSCVSKCPDDFFRQSQSHATAYVSMGSTSSSTSYTTWICLPCHYTCRTCSGPNDYQCLSCQSDASLHKASFKDTAHCYQNILLDEVDSYTFWYKTLLITVLINVLIISCLLSYICCQRSGKPLDGPGSNTWYKNRQAYHRIARDDENDKDNEHLDENDVSLGIGDYYDSDEQIGHSSDRESRVTFTSTKKYRNNTKNPPRSSLSSSKNSFTAGNKDSYLLNLKPNPLGEGVSSPTRVPLVHTVPVYAEDIINDESEDEMAKLTK